MKNTSTLPRWLLAIVLLSFAISAGLSQTPSPSVEKNAPHPDVARFAGLWNGSYYQNSWKTNYSMLLEIRPVKDREIAVTLEWVMFGMRARTSGMGLVTPECVSWVELKTESGDGVDLFSRYMANVSTNNELKGKCFLESTSEEGGTFTLKKTNLEELNAFRAKNTEALDRLHVAARNVEFLDPAWRSILSATVLWLDQTLGYDFKMIDESILPEQDYARNLASALEKRENLFVRKAGTEIPLGLKPGGDPSLHLRTYVVSVPKDFPGHNRKYPIIIQLHGGGGGRRPVHFNAPDNADDSPFIRVKPISQAGWQPRPLNHFLAEAKRVLPIDENRVYLGGGSMGGFGTYNWAMANPELFAAIAPACGGGDVFRAPRLKNLPVWIFHGEQDEAVPFWFAETMLTALQACGAKVKFTFYPEGKHNLSPLMDMKALEQWFLEQTRSSAPIPPDPIDELKLGADGLGPKQILTLPDQRLASIQIKEGREYRSDSRLYALFKGTGRRAQGYLQHQKLPSLPEGMENLILELPKDLDAKNADDAVKVFETTKSRALSFAMVARETKAERELIESVINELKARGETPTGEIRITNLTRYSANWTESKRQAVQRVEILLK